MARARTAVVMPDMPGQIANEVMGDRPRVSMGRSRLENAMEAHADAVEEATAARPNPERKKALGESVFAEAARNIAATHGINQEEFQIGFFHPHQFQVQGTGDWELIPGERVGDALAYKQRMQYSEEDRMAGVIRHREELTGALESIAALPKAAGRTELKMEAAHQTDSAEE